jgi:hypothetical protein
MTPLLEMVIAALLVLLLAVVAAGVAIMVALAVLAWKNVLSHKP